MRLLRLASPPGLINVLSGIHQIVDSSLLTIKKNHHIMSKDTFVKICIAIIRIDLMGVILCFCTGCNTAQITTSRALVHLSNGTDSPEFQMENTIRIERDSVYRTSQTGREFRYPRTACRMRHGVIFLTDSYNHVTEYRP